MFVSASVVLSNCHPYLDACTELDELVAQTHHVVNSIYMQCIIAEVQLQALTSHYKLVDSLTISLRIPSRFSTLSRVTLRFVESECSQQKPPFRILCLGADSVLLLSPKQLLPETNWKHMVCRHHGAVNKTNIVNT